MSMKAMKTNQLIFILTLVATLCGCKGNEKKRDCNAILIDLTDSLTSVSEFNPTELRELFKIQNDLNASSYCLLASITDKRYNRYSIRTIESQNSFEANEIERRKLRDSFFFSIHNDILKIKSESAGRRSSFICYAISNTIERLNRCKDCGQKRIIVLSDLMENSDVFSVYNSQQWKLMNKKPEEIYPILDHEYPIKNANGIELIIKHQPLSPIEDEKFHGVYRFFERYYTMKGMKVNIDNSRL